MKNRNHGLIEKEIELVKLLIAYSQLAIFFEDRFAA